MFACVEEQKNRNLVVSRVPPPQGTTSGARADAVPVGEVDVDGSALGRSRVQRY